MLRFGNLHSKLFAPAGGEAHETLFDAPNVRIERIVSFDHASPQGLWYDQPDDEWVVVIAGHARLEFEEGERRDLKTGDWMLIPAGMRHRIERTGAETIWLAVHVTS